MCNPIRAVRQPLPPGHPAHRSSNSTTSSAAARPAGHGAVVRLCCAGGGRTTESQRLRAVHAASCCAEQRAGSTHCSWPGDLGLWLHHGGVPRHGGVLSQDRATLGRPARLGYRLETRPLLAHAELAGRIGGLCGARTDWGRCCLPQAIQQSWYSGNVRAWMTLLRSARRRPCRALAQIAPSPRCEDLLHGFQVIGHGGRKKLRAFTVDRVPR